MAMISKRELARREAIGRTELRTYFYSLDEAARKRFAKLCGTSVAYVSQQINGVRAIQPGMAMLMEIHSTGALSAETLSPQAPWQQWWDARGGKPAPVYPGT